MGVTKPQTEDTTKEPPLPKPQPTPPEDIDPANVPLDLFGIIFKCKMSDSPWLSMLAHAVAIQEPLLAILAACEKVRFRALPEVLQVCQIVRKPCFLYKYCMCILTL